jgi:hypothetical protein
MFRGGTGRRIAVLPGFRGGADCGAGRHIAAQQEVRGGTGRQIAALPSYVVASGLRRGRVFVAAGPPAHRHLEVLNG